MGSELPRRVLGDTFGSLSGFSDLRLGGTIQTKYLDEVPVEALWVSPAGEHIPVIEHLIEISRFPERFGLTHRDVKDLSIAGLRDISVEIGRAHV